MKDLEKIISAERSRFDEIEEVPHEMIWQGINSQLKNTPSPITIWLAIAAGLALVFVAGMLLQQHRQNKNHTPTFTSLSEIEWEAEQNRLVSLVNNKKNEIGFDTLTAQHFPTVFEQLREQEENYEELLADRRLYPDENALLKILIKYHERQLQLLETLSRESKKKEIQHEKLLY